MDQAQQKVVQYLNEAHATEVGLIRDLQAQIAITPAGSYRSGLEKHLGETRRHAERVERRLSELGASSNPVLAGVGLFESALAQTVAFWKVPLNLVRGTGGEEKVLKNAKDACAAEALEIATYTALEQLARAVGDDDTAALAASIRGDEEKMLDRIMRELPKLAKAVVQADVHGEGSYDITTTGAAEAVREAGEEVKATTRKAAASTRKTARQARKVPGVARAEGGVKGAVASADDLPIARYDQLNADEITGKLAELSQVDLAKVDAYERRHEDRATVLSRISSLRGDEPWPGYDELTVAEVRAALGGADDERAKAVRTYERAHKQRAGILEAAERELSNA
jgi:ferritin-like metal-binding protein YciE